MFVEVVQLFSAQSLVEIRHRQGISQEELARRAGLATVTISKLEEGRILDPKSSTLAKLAIGLGCTVDDLVGVPH